MCKALFPELIEADNVAMTNARWVGTSTTLMTLFLGRDVHTANEALRVCTAQACRLVSALPVHAGVHRSTSARSTNNQPQGAVQLVPGGARGSVVLVLREGRGPVEEEPAGAKVGPVLCVRGTAVNEGGKRGRGWLRFQVANPLSNT